MLRLCSWTRASCGWLWLRCAPACTSTSVSVKNCSPPPALDCPQWISAGPLPVARRHLTGLGRSETTSVAPAPAPPPTTGMTSHAVHAVPHRNRWNTHSHVPSRPHACMKGDDPLRARECKHTPSASPMTPAHVPPQDRPAGDEPPCAFRAGTIGSTDRPSIIEVPAVRRGAAFPTIRFDSFPALPFRQSPQVPRLHRPDSDTGVGVLQRPSAFSQSRRTLVLVPGTRTLHSLLRCSDATGAASHVVSSSAPADH